MASRPPNLQNNSFNLLLTPPRKKRNIHGTEFPSICSSSLSSLDNPRYIILSAKEGDKKITSYSCFGIYNSLHAIDKGIISVTTLRDGNLLVLVKSQSVANKFLKRDDLPGVCKISAKLHNSLNYVKGTIYAPYLNDITEDEIVKELSMHKVVAAHKFSKIIDGNQKPTGVVLLTFDCFHIPQKISVAWNIVNVKEYIPNPMRCKTCQRLGHTAKFCKNAALCATCSLPPHLPDRACTQVLCANCNGEHEASSRECPKYLESKQILKIKTVNKCTLREAKNIYNSYSNDNTNKNESYAAVAATTNTNNNNNNNKNLTTKNLNNNNPTISKSQNNNKKYPTPTTPINTNYNNTNNSISSAKIADSITAQYTHNTTTPQLNSAYIAAKDNTSNTISETTSIIDKLEQNILNKPFQNSTSFIPLKSTNSVLNKSQQSLITSSDSDN